MYTIGLTGGIGSGKSTVSKLISEKGFKILDADEISRSMTGDESPLLGELTDAFGREILAGRGKLDRKKLADIAFSDKQKKDILQSIVTDRVIEKIKREKAEARRLGVRLLFIDAPLLFECGVQDMCDFTWVVTAGDDVRIRRVIQRDFATRDEVEARIRNQMSQSEKVKLADEVIDNSGRMEDLKKQVDKLIKKYAEL